MLGGFPSGNSLKISTFLGVARGLLQERPLQFQHGNVRVKSWQPMSNSWSASSRPDFVRALGRRKTTRNRPSKILYTELLKVGQLLVNCSQTPHSIQARFCTQSCSKLANSWSTARQLPTPWEVAGVFLVIVLWQHRTFTAWNRTRKRTCLDFERGHETFAPIQSRGRAVERRDLDVRPQDALQMNLNGAYWAFRPLERKHMSGGGNLLPKFMPISFFRPVSRI